MAANDDHHDAAPSPPRGANRGLRRLLARTRTFVQVRVANTRCGFYRRVWGMDIGRDVRISMKAHLDFTNPAGVHIGDETIVTPGVRIFTHDFVHGRHVDTYIGRRCFIGANSVVTPGVTIGDHCVVGAGSIVTKDVPAGSIVGGNPARVLRSGITTDRFGTFPRDAEGGA